MNTGSSHAETGASPKILTVGELNRAVAGLLERNFPLVWVSGEVSNLTRAASGHWYFSLKDRDAQVRCVMFRSRNQGVDWPLREGDKVEARALAGLYAARGEFQLTVEQLRRAGAGSLFEAFLRLKEKLASEGLFDEERKRPLVRFPRVMGIVTSPQAAALRDVLTTLARRAPHVALILYPAPVQGSDAPGRLVAAIEAASRRAALDGIETLLLVRGGGSIEDLMAFNHESVARAVAACSVPVVSGVGHETDFTIADFVADVRAPTPTAAAELASPDRQHWLAELALRRGRLLRAWQRGQRQAEQRLDDATRRLKSPLQRVSEAQLRLDDAARRLRAVLRARLEQSAQRLLLVATRLAHRRPDTRSASLLLDRLKEDLRTSAERALLARQTRLELLGARLKLLDSANTLARGYAIAADAQGRIVRDAAQLSAGEALQLRFARGSAVAVVREQSQQPDQG